MVDLNRRQVTPPQSAGVIRVAGVNGSNLIPDLSQSVQSPQTVEIPNVSGRFFDEATQSINRATAQQQQLISQRSQAAANVARAQTQNPGSHGISGVIGGLAAGMELFMQLRQQRQQQQIEFDTARFEQQVRDQIINMNGQLADNVQNQGFIPTQRQTFQAIEREFGHLPIQVRQQVFSLAQNALNEAQKTQNTRRFTALQEVRDSALSLRKEALDTQVTGFLVGLEHIRDPGSINETLDRIFETTDNFLSANGIQGNDAIEITRHIYEQANAYLEDNFKHTSQSQSRLNRYIEATNRAQRVFRQFPNDIRQQQAHLGAIQAEFGGDIPGINFASLLPTNAQLLRQRSQEINDYQAIQQFEQANEWRAQESNDVRVWRQGSTIFNIFHNTPTGNDIRLGVETGQIDNRDLVIAVQLAEDFSNDRRTYDDLLVQFEENNIELATIDAELQRLADQLEPTLRLGPAVAPDVIAQRLAVLSGEERGMLSPETANALDSKLQLREQIVNVRQRRIQRDIANLTQQWNNYGLSIDNPNSTDGLTDLESRAKPLLEQMQREQQDRRSRLPAGLGGPPNFSVGTMQSIPPIVPLHTDREGLTLPFQQASVGQIIATSEYGPRINPVTGRAGFHAGLDIDTTNGDHNVRAVAGGEVIHVSDWPGFGGTVTVRTDSGHVEQYSHLRRFNVSPGDIIPPGTVIGLMGGEQGDPMAGRSTGRHLHFQVYSPDTNIEQIGRPPYEGTTVNPRDYLVSIQNSIQLPLGAGLPPTQSHPGSDQQSAGNSWLNETYNNYRPSRHTGGGFIYSGDLSAAVTPQSLYNNSNPQPITRASIHNASYPSINDPTHNYGYGILRDEPEFASEVARVSNNLGFPAQWLVDVMDFESGLNPASRNSLGAVGLIQFFPGGGLTQVANELGVSESQATNLLSNMSRAEQMRFVELYLRPYASRINTVEDLLAAVFGGPRLLNKDPARRRRISDGFITFGEYVTRLGNRVGRRYQTSYDRTRAAERNIHHSFSSSCPRCNQQLAQFGTVYPHEAE